MASKKRLHKQKRARQANVGALPTTCDIAIIGGGAAGLACAVACGQAYAAQCEGAAAHAMQREGAAASEGADVLGGQPACEGAVAHAAQPDVRASAQSSALPDTPGMQVGTPGALSDAQPGASVSDVRTSTQPDVRTSTQPDVRTSVQPGAAKCPRIVVLEQGRRVGASIMRSGNGRCNFSNAQVNASNYYGADLVAAAFAAQAEQHSTSVTQWFEQLGLAWYEAPGSGGLLYPFSRKADSVLEVLVRAAHEYGVELYTEAAVLEVRQLPAGKAAPFVLTVQRGESSSVKLQASQVVWACGGNCLPQALQLVIPAGQWRPFVPVLGPLRMRAPAGVSLASLDGIRVQARVTLYKAGEWAFGKQQHVTSAEPASAVVSVVASASAACSAAPPVPAACSAAPPVPAACSTEPPAPAVFSEEGEVLFRSYGISGIVVFNASRFAKPDMVCALDLLPTMSADQAQQFLERRLATLGGAVSAQHFFEGFLLAPLAQAVCAVAGVLPEQALTSSACVLLAQALKGFPLVVEGVEAGPQCQVHRGGLVRSAVCPATMEVASTPGLYVVGEALDIDGPCGGYNLHWAWTSGRLAGRAAAARHAGADGNNVVGGAAGGNNAATADNNAADEANNNAAATAGNNAADEANNNAVPQHKG